MKRLGLIHTVPSLVDVFQQLGRDVLQPGCEVINLIDESLLKDTISAERVLPVTRRRLAGHVFSLVDAGADAVMVTCSSIGPAVETARPLCDVPVLRVDEAMADRAVAEGSHVGVLATLHSTLRPTVELIRVRAASMSRQVRIVEHVCEGAFTAASRGDVAHHDELVREGLRILDETADVIVLAQASMARVLPSLAPGDLEAVVLSSPRLAMEHAAATLTAP
jgi:Asp/Glu/hydantoin racemase